MSARPKFRDIAADPTLALMLALGFSSGLPFLLILGTQAARLAEAKIPIEEIGLLSWVGLCYSLKFLWAPIIDEVDLPWLAKVLGRRRAWLITAQIGVAGGLVALAFADPAHSLFGLIVRAAITAFAPRRRISSSTAGASISRRPSGKASWRRLIISAIASASSRPARARSISLIIPAGGRPISSWRR